MNTLQRIAILGAATTGAALLAPSAAMASTAGGDGFGRGFGGANFVTVKQIAGPKGIAASRVVAGFGRGGFGGFGGFGGGFGHGFGHGPFFKKQKFFAGPKGVASFRQFAGFGGGRFGGFGGFGH
ncbi:hypothetical protein [Actinomadura keratinilytica]|uniref:BA14K family protein n=1 Tax=Actinomadura keratinilytica TaxID=547461 RepID=A0ABP7YV63_9ACTN